MAVGPRAAERCDDERQGYCDEQELPLHLASLWFTQGYRGEDMKPRLLDLFCGAGGAAMGYARAGFKVVGVDIKPQPNYPFVVVEMDALEALEILSRGWAEFDAIHASPPCQFATAYKRTGNVKASLNLIPQVRELLEQTGLPYVIENVEQARDWLYGPIRLCGSMFEGKGMYDVQRHRLFEANWPLRAPEWGCRHKIWAPGRYPASTNRSAGSRRTMQVGQWSIPLSEQSAGMGIDWMTLEELSESIPPAYTEFIGTQLMAHLKATVAA